MSATDSETLLRNVLKLLQNSTKNKSLKSNLLEDSSYCELKKLTEEYKIHPKQILSLIEALDLVNTHHSSEIKNKINEECIYWCKAATNIDICNPTLSENSRLDLLYSLVIQYTFLHEYEFVLEHGLFAVQFKNSFPTAASAKLTEHRFMLHLGKASQHLRKYDEAIDYFKKAVKLCVKSKDMKKSDLIGCYENLLEAQVRGKNYREAAQTVKKIKIYNLNSEVTTDLDLADLAAEARSVEFCTSKNCTPHPVRSRELVPDSILRLYLVAKICRWKAEIHKAFEEPVEATCWANMFANLCEKLQDNFPRGLDLEMGRDTNAGKVYGYLTVSRLPNYMEDGDSPIAQESICRKLFMWMQSAPQIKLPVAILQETAKRYRVKHEDFMPFLKYFITNHSSIDSKAKLTNFRNTILINNHFLSRFEDKE